MAATRTTVRKKHVWSPIITDVETDDGRHEAQGRDLIWRQSARRVPSDGEADGGEEKALHDPQGNTNPRVMCIASGDCGVGREGDGDARHSRAEGAYHRATRREITGERATRARDRSGDAKSERAT